MPPLPSATCPASPGPDHTGSADSESVVAYTHILTNTGNGSDVFDLAHSSSQDWSVAYETPLSVGRGQTATVLVSITVPAGSGGLTDVTTITATSQADAGVWATTTDTTVVAALTPGAPTLLAPPNGTVTTTQAITFTWAPTTTGDYPTGYNLKLDDVTIITTTVMTLVYQPAHWRPHLDGARLQRFWLLGLGFSLAGGDNPAPRLSAAGAAKLSVKFRVVW